MRRKIAKIFFAPKQNRRIPFDSATREREDRRKVCETKANAEIEVPIVFKDVDVLNLTNTSNPFPETADNDFITAASGEIILPTARNIRITLRAVGEAKADYWGIENLADTKLDSRYGKTTVITMRRES